MSLENIFGMAGGAMDAQSKRLALAVENIANSDVLAGDQASAYKAKRVNFATILQHQARDDRRFVVRDAGQDNVHDAGGERADGHVPALVTQNGEFVDDGPVEGFDHPRGADDAGGVGDFGGGEMELVDHRVLHGNGGERKGKPVHGICEKQGIHLLHST